MYYDSIELTPEEIEQALIEARKKKFFHLRNADYWKDQIQNGIDANEEEKKSKRDAYRQAKEASSGSKVQTLSVEYRSTPAGLLRIEQYQEHHHC